MSLTWPVLLCEGGGHAPGEEVLGRPVRMLHRALGGGYRRIPEGVGEAGRMENRRSPGWGGPDGSS